MGIGLRRRLIALASALVLALIAASCALSVSAAYLAADYPGATQTSSETLVRYLPSLAIKRTSAYRSADAFPLVYNWYSQRFSLGPERHAQGGCILMARSFTTLWVVREQITVTVCSTPGGQMMFVSRSSVLPYGKWL